MNSEVLFLFLILLFGLLVCSFLGDMNTQEGMRSNTKSGQNRPSNDGVDDDDSDDSSSSNNYDNYNHFNKSSSQLSTGNTFYSENGGTVEVGTNNDGSQTLTVTLEKGSSPITLTQSKEGYTTYSNSNGSATKFYGPNNTSATVIQQNGQPAVKITNNSGTTVFTQQGVATNSNNSNNSNNYNNISPSQYYGATGVYGGPNNPPGPAGGAGYNPPGIGAPGAGALPDGIPGRLIPHGQEDLYILKSQVVPPVCPACPSAASCPRQEPCPACPPCGRCPEAPFECKKVPNYNAINDEFLPAPVVNSFSSF